jgi:FkbM family methyltransferase
MLQSLRAALRRIPGLVRLKRRVTWYMILRRTRGYRLMRVFARLYPQAFFIQIGANDGEQLDHLRHSILKGRWRGIMIEPVPYVFERLRQNYGHLSDRLTLESVAIAPAESRMPFWHLRKAEAGTAELPRWYDALGSFRKDVVLKHKEFIPDIEERLTSTQVPTLSFRSLCEKHGVEAVDLIQMDTEGYDFEIIKLIDFVRYRPVLLIYEHLHLDESTRQVCEAHLREQGYELFSEQMDTWCLDMRAKNERHQKLLQTWNRLALKPS